MSRIVFLAPANSIHTTKIINGLASFHDVHLISFQSTLPTLSPSVKFYKIPGCFGKLSYLIFFPIVFLRLFSIAPDFVNAHYASSYGLLAFLSGRRYFVSVWGSDVYSFMFKSCFHSLIIKLVLHNAAGVLSTSKVMADFIERHIKLSSPPYVIPFGVHVDTFLTKSDYTLGQRIVFGTVKTMSNVYGIDILIYSFALYLQLSSELTTLPPACLRIVGTGPSLAEYQRLATSLGIAHLVEFTGHVPNDQIAYQLDSFDVFLALSRRESFGVSLLEAFATGLPCITSDADGFCEIINNNISGIIVSKCSIYETASAMLRLAQSEQLRSSLGSNARHEVCLNYNISATVSSYSLLFMTGRLPS